MNYTKEQVKEQLIEAGLKADDILMIHSAFSKVKNIEGGASALLEAFKEVINDGILLLPSHTWASINYDGAIMNKEVANSCVGYLTNVAIKDSSFIRSNHPTHSVLGYGKKALKYLESDNEAKTPVSPNGAFGKLKNGGKILFLGAPLSKNTFVHSIEEVMNVEDRFTEHIYTFYTKDKDGLHEFHMPRHYSTKHPHISENYEKLLPIMLRKEIAREVRIMDINAILVDAAKCYDLVISILKQDIHAFDDLRDVEKYAG